MFLDLFTREEAGSILDTILQQEWEEGRTDNPDMKGAVKRNLELRGSAPEVCAALGKVMQRLSEHEEFRRETLPQMIYPARFNRYTPDCPEYKAHTDAAFMPHVSRGVEQKLRTDYSMTLWLTDDYDGGELCIEGQDIRGDVGQAYVYTSDQLHWVKPVTRGERVCCITWIQSTIQSKEDREIITDLRRVMKAMPQFSEEQTVLGKVYGRLMRRWGESL